MCCVQGFLGINTTDNKNINTSNTKMWIEVIFTPEGTKRTTDPSVILDSKVTKTFYCSSEWGKVFKLFLPWSIQQRKVSLVTFNVWLESGGGSKKLYASR